MSEDSYDNRRSSHRLDSEELEKVAQRAADIVEERITLQVGKTTIRLVIYVLGAVLLVALSYFGLYPKIKP